MPYYSAVSGIHHSAHGFPPCVSQYTSLSSLVAAAAFRVFSQPAGLLEVLFFLFLFFFFSLFIFAFLL
jgi:hypothetical protein